MKETTRSLIATTFKEAIEYIAEHRRLLPFIKVESDGGVKTINFTEDTLEDMLSAAREVLNEARSLIGAAALAYATKLKFKSEDESYSAVMIEAYEEGQKYTYALRYTTQDGEIKVVGEIMKMPNDMQVVMPD